MLIAPKVDQPGNLVQQRNAIFSSRSTSIKIYPARIKNIICKRSKKVPDLPLAGR